MDLFVTFQEPFWVAIVLVRDRSQTRVFRHVFGPSEPTEPDVVEFVRVSLPRLLHGPEAARVGPRELRLPPTRAARLRLAGDAVDVPVLDAELLDALHDGRRARARARAVAARAAANAAKDRARDIAREKQRQHHRRG